MPASEIARFSSRTEADIVVARLVSEGIAARSVTDSAGGVEPQLELIRGVRVMVPDTDLADAAAVLGVEVPDPLPPLSETQERVVSALQWAAVLVSALGLATVAIRALSG